jgi:hypothetical protein
MTSKRQFVLWVQQKYPTLFRNAVSYASLNPLNIVQSTAPFNLGQVDADTPVPVIQASESTMDSLFSAIEKLIPSVLTYQQSRDLVQLNLELAKQGKPLVDAQSLSPQVNVGVSSDISMLLKIALFGGLALLAIKTLRK